MLNSLICHFEQQTSVALRYSDASGNALSATGGIFGRGTMMPELVPVDGERFKCSACDQLFFPPPVPRGARPWTPDEARAKLASQFNEHVEKVHSRSRPERLSDTVRPKERA